MKRQNVNILAHCSLVKTSKFLFNDVDVEYLQYMKYNFALKNVVLQNCFLLVILTGILLISCDITTHQCVIVWDVIATTADKENLTLHAADKITYLSCI